MRGSLVGFLVVLLLPFATLLGLPSHASAALKVFVDGRPVHEDALFLRAGRLFLSARVLEDLRLGTVGVQGSQVEVTGPGRTLRGEVGSPMVEVDGRAMEAEAPLLWEPDGGLILPLRVVAEYGGWRVRFDPEQAVLELVSRTPPGQGSTGLSFPPGDPPLGGPGGTGPGAAGPPPSHGDVATGAPEVPDFAARRQALSERRQRLAQRMAEERVAGPGPGASPQLPPPPAVAADGGGPQVAVPRDGSRPEALPPTVGSGDTFHPGPSTPAPASAVPAPGPGVVPLGDAPPQAPPAEGRQPEAVTPQGPTREPAPAEAGAPASAPAGGGPAEAAPGEGADGPMPTVSGVRVRRRLDRPEIEILADGPLEYAAHLLAEPSRLVIDLPGARWGGEPLRQVEPGPVVRRVRAGQHQPDSVRVVVDLDAPVRFDAHAHGRGLSLHLYQQVGPVRVWEGVAGPVVDVMASGPLRPAISTLEDPYRLVVDLPQASLVTGAAEGEGAGSPIRRWRISQFQPEVVRLVLELDQPLTVRRTAFLPAQADEPNGAGLPGYAGVWRLALGPALEGIGIHPVPSGWAVLIEGESAITPRLSRLMGPHRILVDLPGAVLPGDWLPIRLDDPLVTGVRIARNRPDMVRLVVDATGPMGYQLFPSEDGGRLVIVLRPSSLAGRKIVLDPGHGGHDPGAIGVTGLVEATVNLEIARRLGERLVAEGAQVYWTREDDVFIPLEARAELANRVQADLFMSIHNNSCPANCTGSGTETYFLPSRWENQVLAGALQEELVRSVGLLDRGLRQRNLSVLRRSEVPAALVEVAFLSSREEEALLRDGAFLERAAEGLFQGVQRYFAELASERAPLKTRLDEGTLAVVEELLERGLAAVAYRQPSGDGERAEAKLGAVPGLPAPPGKDEAS